MGRTLYQLECMSSRKRSERPVSVTKASREPAKPAKHEQHEPLDRVTSSLDRVASPRVGHLVKNTNRVQVCVCAAGRDRFALMSLFN